MTNVNVPSSSKRFGGSGGDAFADAQAVTATGPITKIEVRAGDQIDSIRVIYGAAGNGGRADSFTVPDGRRLCGAKGDRTK